MTDRIQALIVTLDGDIRDDDLQPVIAAIGQIKHVIAVDPIVAKAEDHISRTKVRLELYNKILKLIEEDRGLSL